MRSYMNFSKTIKKTCRKMEMYKHPFNLTSTCPSPKWRPTVKQFEWIQDRNAGGGRTRSAIGPPEDREAGAACGTGGGAPAAALPRLPCRVGLQNMGNTTDRLALVVGVSLLSSLATLLAVGEIQVL